MPSLPVPAADGIIGENFVIVVVTVLYDYNCTTTATTYFYYCVYCTVHTASVTVKVINTRLSSTPNFESLSYILNRAVEADFLKAKIEVNVQLVNFLHLCIFTIV